MSDGMLQSVTAVARRDLLLALRLRTDLLTIVFFFAIVVSLFPLGVGADPVMLHSIGPGVVWVAALLASMLALSRLFSGDFADGTLEQLVLAGEPLAALAFAKVIAHWLATGLPLVVLSPLLGLEFGLDGRALWVLAASLAIGTPVLSLLGAIGAALTLGVRGGGALTALLVLPLYVPVLIFGAGAVSAASQGMQVGGHLSVLGALLFAAIALAPWAQAAAIRIALE
ncbi:MAG TPA: heme exporter protein CcmB [Burkholderiales bacterium]|nr:heme exporter protein CcmB [Burkholderiales bacterium]